MAFYSGFFNSQGLDRTYTAEDFTSYLSSIICNGILDTYGSNFSLTASSGLKVSLGTGKAWINGHYFINDASYSIDLSQYQDESLPRYVAISIVCDTSEEVRAVSLEVVPGTPSDLPVLPEFEIDEQKARLLLYAVRIDPEAISLSEYDWFDYRDDNSVCGYCRCILGKCKVTDIQAQIAQLIAEMQWYNGKISELENKVTDLESKVKNFSGDIIAYGTCGDNVQYVLFSGGTLLISGSGDMYDYESYSNPEGNMSPFHERSDISSVVISDGITSVGTFAFNFCNSIKTASLPNSLARIGRNAFMPHIDEYVEHHVLNGLTSLTLPPYLSEIGRYAFSGTGITELTVPASVIKVDIGAFSECQALETVRYEGKVIGDRMFASCTGLISFTIASTVEEISSGAFNYCSNLEVITYEGSLEAWAVIRKEDKIKNTSGLNKIQCLDGYLQFNTDSNEWEEVMM